MVVSVDLEIGDRLEQLSERAKEAVEQSFVLTSLETEKEIKLRCPVDTGNLRRSIKPKPDGLNGFSIVGAYYGNYVNNGTSRMDANPFITVSAHQVPKLFKRNMQEQLRARGLI